MAKYIHNPRCSKSREGLSLLKDKLEFDTILYLKGELTKKILKDIFGKININKCIRSKESIYKNLNLNNKNLTKTEWIDLVLKNPILLERPILITDKEALIGRPPEVLLEII